MDDKERAEKQKRWEELEQNFENNETNEEESIERTMLYFELHPEDKYWNDDRTPAEIWGPMLDEIRQKKGQQ